MRTHHEMNAGPAIFQLGIPALAGLPEKLFARARSSNLLRIGSFSSMGYPDPKGELELRREIAGYLAISRNLHCFPEQVFITSGYNAGLGLALRVLSLDGKKVWMEEPGFHLARKGLALAHLRVVPVPVDAEGIKVGYGIEHAADAALAVVTPGQQAPLGPTLSLRRRLQLLEWAAASGAWIIEDDYLGELQLDGRAAPALASQDEGKRVIHIGSFSKTVSPGLRLDLWWCRPNWRARSPTSLQRLPPRPRQSFNSQRRNSCTMATTSGASAGSSACIPPSVTRYASSYEGATQSGSRPAWQYCSDSPTAHPTCRSFRKH
jgi:GntR family transcriptional regulator/MocR family aminotransferase